MTAAAAMQSFDLVVIGGGPGGYVAAIRSAQLGLKTALIEKQHLGGICLNWGCIPTKALLKGAEVAHTLQTLDRFGFTADNIRFDIGKLVGHSRSVAGQLNQGVAYLMKKNNIRVFDGHARFEAKGQLSVEHEGSFKPVGFAHCIIATGAHPKSLPGLDIHQPRVWTYFEAMVPKTLPESLLVIGAGAIGVEFASLYADLGTQVTLVEMASEILPAEETAVSRHVAEQFSKRGIEVCAAAGVQDFEFLEDRVRCTLTTADQQTRREFQYVITAIGVQGNVEDLALERIGGVKVDKGFIQTDSWSRTGAAGVYAIGDVAGPPCLAHKASHEGIACVEHLAGLEGARPLDRARIPACTFSRPQVASVGLTEAAAKNEGHRVRSGHFPLTANGKALAIGEAEGFVKTIFDAETGELLGAHMVGPEVTEQIQGLVIAQQLETTDYELTHAIFPHPTVSEAIHESVLAAQGRAIHN